LAVLGEMFNGENFDELPARAGSLPALRHA